MASAFIRAESLSNVTIRIIMPHALETIILGEALNISTRLESLTKDHAHCKILISEDTYHLLTEQLEHDMCTHNLLIIKFIISGIQTSEIIWNRREFRWMKGGASSMDFDYCCCRFRIRRQRRRDATCPKRLYGWRY